MPEPTFLEKRFDAKSPKRILAMDGGGIRGALTLGYLERIESLLRKRYNNDKLVLSDYFDLIGGTSTGAIIAASLAIGKSVKELKEKYLKLGGEIFGDKKGFLGVYTNYKYDETPLKKALKDMFGDIKIGDEGDNGLKTGLCIVAKRLDTFSTWPLCNHPRAKYFARNRFFLRDFVRASTAAPSYFIPEIMDVGDGQLGTFVDGGLSIMNNPSFQLFLMATLKGFPFHWDTGRDNMLIISVGTGRRDAKLAGKKYKNPNLLTIAQLAPEQFMHDASEIVELTMQYLSESLTARKIDREIGNLQGDKLNETETFTYNRFNIDLDKVSLAAAGITNLSDEKIEGLTEMDDAANRYILADIGEKAAESQLQDLHLPGAFDLKK
jgi:patatin-like phospholipase/acyl hydrolase